MLKAHAGAGKSVTLRRIAWEAARRHGRLVLFTKSPSGLSVDAFEEIVSLTNQTIYLVIDDLADVEVEAERLIRHASKKSRRLVVIAGARVHEWNTRCEPLHALVDEQYDLKYLSEAEIDGLLAKLEAARLPWLPRISDARKKAFAQAVRTAEERLRQGLQKFPNEPYLLAEEATLSATLSNAERALKALGKAFEKNPRSELVARRYARVASTDRLLMSCDAPSRIVQAATR